MNQKKEEKKTDNENVGKCILHSRTFYVKLHFPFRPIARFILDTYILVSISSLSTYIDSLNP